MDPDELDELDDPEELDEPVDPEELDELDGVTDVPEELPGLKLGAPLPVPLPLPHAEIMSEKHKMIRRAAGESAPNL